MDSKKVNVLGWFNHGNVGDENYKLSFPTVLCNHQFTFIEELKSSIDVCILGGGDVVNGYFLDHIKKAKRKLALSVSLPYNITKETLDIFDVVCVRDTKSYNIAMNLGKEVYLYPDFSFYLGCNKEAGKDYLLREFTNKKLDNYEKKIGIIINSNLLPNSDSPAYKFAEFEKFCFDITHCIDNLGYSFVFIPFGTSIPTDDIISNGYIANKCKFWKKNLFIKDELDVWQTLNVIAGCDIIVSTRLHSSIFSCIANVPFIDITHNHKNPAFLNDIEYDYRISLQDFSKKDFQLLINKVEQNSQEIKTKLQNITEENRFKLQDINNHVHIL